jgi:WD40 repeat protein
MTTHQRFVRHTSIVRDAKYAPKGDMFATASDDKQVLIWDTKELRVLYTFKHTKQVYALSWHPTDKEILCAGHDGVHYWSCRTGLHMNSVQLDEVWSVAWFPDGKRFVCGDVHGNMYVYTQSGLQLYRQAFHENYRYLNGIAMVSDTQFLAVASNAQKVDSSRRYGLALVTVSQGAIMMEWMKTGAGSSCFLSPLYGDTYVFIGADDSASCLGVR